MYTNQMQAADWVFAITGASNQLSSDIQRGSILNDKFATITYGLTDAQILSLPQFATWTEADLTNVKYALGAMKDLSNALNNISALVQANRFGYLEPFLL